MSESLSERIEYLEVRMSEIDDLRSNVSLASEALQKVHAILHELLTASDFDYEDFREDLDRIDQIAHLLI
jgi:hypothetical protein